MNPITMEMPDKIEDEIDELDADTVDNYEVIDVPVRHTCKAQAIVRVGEIQPEAVWVAGWLMQSTKKTGGEIGSEKLSTGRPNYDSKLLAVNAALAEMGKVAGGHDQRLKDDILAFRDKEWFVADGEQERTDDSGELDDDKRHPDEPRANEHGVLVEGVETFDIAIPKSYKSYARVEIAQGSTGTWFMGNGYSTGKAGGGGMPQITGTPYQSKKAAALAACEFLLDHVGKHEPKIGKCIAKFQAEVEAWTEEITAPAAEAPASDQAEAAAAESEQATLSPRPTQAEIETEFKVRLHDATDDLAAAVLARMKAEAIFKTAKAEEKAAAETLQKLANRGPESYPLFDAPKGKAISNGVVEMKAGDVVVSPNGWVSKKPDADAWKAAPLSVLELPNGIADKLAGDGLDTVGRLEQRRADVAQKREKWPKGIGKGAIDKIEDAQLKWLTANQGTWVAPVTVTKSETDPNVKIAGAKPDPDSIGDVASRAGILIQQGFEPTESELPTYDSGREAFGKGWQLTDCPYVPGRDQDLWLIGFKDAEKEARDDESDE